LVAVVLAYGAALHYGSPAPKPKIPVTAEQHEELHCKLIGTECSLERHCALNRKCNI